MIEQGIDIKSVIICTGLTKKEIEEIKKNISEKVKKN